MRLPIPILLVVLALPAFAGEVPRLKEVVVTPAGHETPAEDQTHTLSVVPPEELSGARAARSIQDAVERLTGVTMQRTGPGQGSAYIRGLTGFRVLHLVDGIRLNNSTWRSGPNQYLATVDSLSLRSVEVVHGPSSVLYGSDSIGGTINALPLLPPDPEEAGGFGGRLLERLATGERSAIFRAEASGTIGTEASFLFGGTRRTYGEIEAGDGKLPGTEYGEWDGDFRLLYSALPGLDLTLSYEHVSQNDAPRTHKTVDARPWHGTTRGSELRRDLDQVRDLLFLRAKASSLTATLSWQRQREIRHRDRVGKSDRQGVDVSTFGLSVIATSETDLGRLTGGADAYHDLVDSFRKNYDGTGRLKSEGIQGPVADDSRYTLLGLFLQDEIPVASDLTLTAGLRASHARARAGRFEDPRTGKASDFADRWSALTGSLRFLYTPSETLALFGGVSQGFRAPNLSDLTRFDSARSNEIETPATNLDPEYALAFELGARERIGPVRIDLSLFHTELTDLIQRFPTGREIDGDMEVTKANVGDGFVRGVELRGEVEIASGLALLGGGSLVTGRVETFATSGRKRTGEWLDRLPPLSGTVGLRYEPLTELALTGRVRMADRADRLSPRDEGDTQRIPPGGTPGYGVVDLEAAWRPSRDFSVTLGIENLLDRAYRIHGSGQNQPGLDAYLVVEVRF